VLSRFLSLPPSVAVLAPFFKAFLAGFPPPCVFCAPVFRPNLMTAPLTLVSCSNFGWTPLPFLYICPLFSASPQGCEIFFCILCWTVRLFPFFSFICFFAFLLPNGGLRLTYPLPVSPLCPLFSFCAVFSSRLFFRDWMRPPPLKSLPFVVFFSPFLPNRVEISFLNLLGSFPFPLRFSFASSPFYPEAPPPTREKTAPLWFYFHGFPNAAFSLSPRSFPYLPLFPEYHTHQSVYFPFPPNLGHGLMAFFSLGFFSHPSV